MWVGAREKDFLLDTLIFESKAAWES